MAKIYAYVSSEACNYMQVVLPGTIDTNGKQISRDGDYVPWRYGQRETGRIAADEAGRWAGRAARAVARLLGW